MQCELAVDAVHKLRGEEGDGCGGGTTTHPRREEITDTMIFSPGDLITMTCRDVDLNYATRGVCVGVCTRPFKTSRASRVMSFVVSILSCLVWSDHIRLCAFVDTFTDSAISSSRVNGDHREKVLQRWDGGDSNGENYDLDTDAVSPNMTPAKSSIERARVTRQLMKDLCQYSVLVPIFHLDWNF